MSSSASYGGGGSGGGPCPSRLSRIDLDAHGDDDVHELDYSEHAGPSNPSRHMASRRAAWPPTRRSSSSNNPSRDFYHNRDDASYASSSSSSHREPYPHPRLPTRPRSRSPSPQPDAEVLAYIRAQKQASTSTSKHERELAEQLKREKFQHGAGKVKSRVQKEREAEERKRKQAEEDAAKAYDDFVAAMGAKDDLDDSKQGERSDGTIKGPKKPMGFVGAGGKAYVGSRAEAVQLSKPIVEAESTKPPLKRVNAAFGSDSSDDEQPPSSLAKPSRQQPQRKRQAMTTLLTQLQTEQAERESRLSTLASTTNTSISTLLAHETLAKPGSRDLHSDPLTTNICILTLPAHVDERSMGEFFCQWGDVATVKIMWPRGEQRERTALTGFVAYMTRREAEWAFREADGVVWGGTRVKLSWGKSMPLPSRAMYPMSVKSDASKQEQLGKKRDKADIPKLVIRHRRVAKEEKRQQLRDRVESEYPQTQRLFVETVASRIRGNGAHFEHVLREREAENPKFAFLFETQSLLHHYFRMCLDGHYYAASSHEGRYDAFDDDGSDELYSTDSGEESEAQHLSHMRPSSTAWHSGVPLGPLAAHRLCSMLRSLTLRRERIARITAFALDHSPHSTAIVAILTASLLQPATPIPRKIARLYALSDLLHNSGTPISNAWRYRAEIEAQLPVIFAHLGQLVACFQGRMRREEFKAKVVGVLDVWDGWIVVSPHVLARLRRLFECPPPVTVAAAAKGQAEEVEDVDGEALDQAAPTAAQAAATTVESEDIDDGEEDLDGEAL